jgi:hypothetical protein
MRTFFLRPLLLSNYSLAVAITDWKAEKIFPRAILTTGLQFYFLSAGAIIFVNAKIRRPEDLYFLLGELAMSGILIFGLLRPFTTWLFITLNISSRYRNKSKKQPPQTAVSIVFSLLSFFLMVFAIAREAYISIP